MMIDQRSELSFHKNNGEKSSLKKISNSKNFNFIADPLIEINQSFIPNLYDVCEQVELPYDPKIRFYGRNPKTSVAVRQEYTA